MTIYKTKEFDNMYSFNKLYFATHKDYCIYLWIFFFNYEYNSEKQSSKVRYGKKLWKPFAKYPFFHENENVLDVVFNSINNYPKITIPQTPNSKIAQLKSTIRYNLMYNDDRSSHQSWRESYIRNYNSIYSAYSNYIEYINRIRKTIEKIAIKKILRSSIYNYGLGLKLSMKNCGFELTDQ